MALNPKPGEPLAVTTVDWMSQWLMGLQDALKRALAKEDPESKASDFLATYHEAIFNAAATLTMATDAYRSVKGPAEKKADSIMTAVLPTNDEAVSKEAP